MNAWVSKLNIKIGIRKPTPEYQNIVMWCAILFFSYILVAILLRWSELICTHVEKILDVCLLRCHLQSLQGRGGTN